jgi:hypothetical protein
VSEGFACSSLFEGLAVNFFCRETSTSGALDIIISGAGVLAAATILASGSEL